MRIVTISAGEYVHYQDLLKGSKSITTSAKRGKTCLISSSYKWIIDSGVTDHMTSNPPTFANFRSHTIPFSITIADDSTYNVEGSSTIKHTLIILSCVLSLTNLAFNLISVGKLTKD